MVARARGRSRPVHGDVAPGFGPVADTFRDQLERGRSIGAACAVFRHGEPVVDLWGGERDGDRGLPWERDTVVPVFSTTKGMATMAVAVAHSRGHLDLEERVATYWPAFAQHGKHDVTVRQLLSHQAGLAALDRPIGEDLLLDPEALAPVLAQQAPLWEPGERQGYHAVTLGFYVGELLRRADPAGRTLGRAFAEDVAGPLGIAFHIGLPDHVDDRQLATFHAVHPARGIVHIGSAPRRLLLALCNPRSLTSRAFNAIPIARHPQRINDRRLLRHELASFGGVGNARAIARAYGELATGGRRLGLRPETLTALETPGPSPPGGRSDLVLHSDIPFTLGHVHAFPGFPLGSDARSYAMAGAGGSIGMADPTLGVGFSYTPNRMGFGSPTDPREVALRAALYRCLGGPPQDPTTSTRAARTAARGSATRGGSLTRGGPSRGPARG
jgi:CubicO group peptidase (beta-lactamase class C family)